MKNKVYIAILLMILISGCKELEPRRPKDHSTTSFYKELIEKNKKLNALEKRKIELFLKKDTLKTYKESSNGLWYTYEKKDTIGNISPVKGDVVTIRYDVKNMNGNEIYPLRTMDYKVDEEDFIPGLQNGIKLMKKGETITFVVPSYRGYGVTGDGSRIGMNQTIKSTLTLIEIKKPKNEVK